MVESSHTSPWAEHVVSTKSKWSASEIIEFLSIQKPRAEEFYKKATRAIFEGNRYLALELI